MTPDFSPFRHLTDLEGSEPDGVFINVETGEVHMLRVRGDYWINPFALRFVPVQDLCQTDYQKYADIFGAPEAGAPGY